MLYIKENNKNKEKYEKNKKIKNKCNQNVMQNINYIEKIKNKN